MMDLAWAANRNSMNWIWIEHKKIHGKILSIANLIFQNVHSLCSAVAMLDFGESRCLVTVQQHFSVLQHALGSFSAAD